MGLCLGPRVPVARSCGARRAAGRERRRAACGAAGVRVSAGGDPGTAPLRIRVDGAWLDAGRWAAAHPAGAHWLRLYDGADATEVLEAFHSGTAKELGRRLPRLAPDAAAEADAGVPADSELTLAFRAWRAELERDGWFEREPLREAWHLVSWALMWASAAALAHLGGPLGAACAWMPLGISHCYAGWLAHDYIHGRGEWCTAMRNFGGFAAGFGATMWSEKHNRHHALTNEMGEDEDLSGGPLLWLWAPDPEFDKPWRKFQHIYVGALFSLLHVVWRIDSARVAWDRRNWAELLAIAAHYAVWFAVFDPLTVVLAVLFGGVTMANITSTTHQSEDLFDSREHDWVRAQFMSTRNAVCNNPFSEWLWGGMQYQVEHHLWPTMPRYKYASIRPRVKAFAREHGIEYREAGEFEMIARNYQLYARVAGQPAEPGAAAPRKGTTV